MMYTDVMLQRIEDARQLLYQMEQQYGLRHPRVLKQSMELDELLNRYYRSTYRKNVKPIA
ncbi:MULTISPECIES: aspartyl-phosphate phosphatase Spo0E family protein [Paenibacillus]|nr:MULTISPECIES: aspartyl-phosphate phosphatase Spo0E family protein [Paenibacillus]